MLFVFQIAGVLAALVTRRCQQCSGRFVTSITYRCELTGLNEPQGAASMKFIQIGCRHSVSANLLGITISTSAAG